MVLFDGFMLGRISFIEKNEGEEVHKPLPL